MSLKILACDSGGWDLDQYDAQKGHTICFKTNLCESTIEKICWTFSDDTAPKSNELSPCVVFTKDVGDGLRLPGEGFVTICVYVTTVSHECLCACRKILIVPEVNCQLRFVDDYDIRCDTRCITANINGLCEALVLGNPFPIDAVDGYACGGACDASCPQYEVLIGEPTGTKIIHYGRHCVCANVCIRQSKDDQNLICSPLYEHNFLGLHARYPPIETCFCVNPRNLEMHVVQIRGRRWHKKFVIRNLSEFMLPECSTIKWTISNECGKTYWKEINQCATLCYEFRQLDYYKIEATICVSKCCKPVTVKVYLKLEDCCDSCKDIVVQPEPILADLIPESSMTAGGPPAN